MGASWEEVDGLGGLQRIAAFPQKLDVAGERRGIARDVDDAPRTHRGHRLDDIRADALARRIDDDDVRPFSFGREHLRGLPGVHAVKFRLIRLSPAAFYQVNHDQAEILYRKALQFAALTGTETVLDLYCGTGTITLCLARHAKKAVGVEIIPQAIEDAKFNAAQNGMDNAEFYCMDAGAAAKLLAGRGEKPDVIVVDPPRKGVSADVIEAIAAMQPQRVVYVSCDPATLARDVKLLTETGYALQSAEAVDLFPRCAHVESVVLLERS